MTRVVTATAYGGPEVLAIEEQEVAPPAAGEVRLAVRAAGVNPIDWKRYGGAMGTDAPLPMRLGFEAAGTVTAVGADAVGPAGPIAVGDEVIAFPIDGGYADEVVVPAGAVVPKPATLPWEAAAGLLLTGATAMHTLAATGVGAGETVLVHAAAGGVGLMVSQIAVARGARVVGTASERNHAVLRALGVVPVVYGAGLVARVRAAAPDGVDAAIDCVGTDEAVDSSLALVDDRQRIASIAAFDRGAEAGIVLLGGGPGADPGTALRDAARLPLTELAEQGALTVRTRAFALADVAAAHRAGQAGHTVGKLVLVP